MRSIQRDTYNQDFVIDSLQFEIEELKSKCPESPRMLTLKSDVRAMLHQLNKLHKLKLVRQSEAENVLEMQTK